MTDPQNLCLICCYTFQSKRSRFISPEARQSFQNFCKELGVNLEGGNGIEGDLHLPFGDPRLTVCGDCLSLVDIYVQRRCVQRDKEETLLELQRRVVKLISELERVVEDVQCTINRLHGTIRMGEEGNLERFVGEEIEDAREVRSFREKILSLNIMGKHKRNEQVVIKTEPLEEEEDEPQLLFDDNPTTNITNASASFFGGDHSNQDSSSNADAPSTSPPTKRRILRRRTVVKPEVTEEMEEDPQDFSDTDLYQQQIGEGDEDDGSSMGGDFTEEVEATTKSERPVVKRKYRRRRKRMRPRTGGGTVGTELKRVLKYGNILTPERAAKWKQDLLSRVSAAQLIDGKGEGGAVENQFRVGEDDGHLQFRGISVKVVERKRMLECQRCYKMYFEERDVTDPDLHLETLMRQHILDKHCVVKVKKAVEEMEVIEYTSHTKSKITYKLADKNRYSYTRRCGKKEAGASYFRCDFRKGNCSASILHKNGKYIRLRKGWNPETGTHTVHPPDVDRTNKQIALGQAKYMYLTDDSKTIDEVCSIILDQTGQAPPPVPLTKLKRAMVYSKYGSRGMAPEEKMSQVLQCSFCGKIYKEGRGLSRHMAAQHQDQKQRKEDVPLEEEVQAFPNKDLRLLRRESLLKMGVPIKGPGANKNKKPAAGGDDPETKDSHRVSETSTSPSIVFSDPSAANNFVNRCINAIMQQVGISAPVVPKVPSSDPPLAHVGAPSTELPSASEQPPQVSHCARVTSVPHSSTTSPRSLGNQTSHWNQSQQASSNSPLLQNAPHQGQPCNATSSSAPPGGNNSVNPLWPWGLQQL